MKKILLSLTAFSLILGSCGGPEKKVEQEVDKGPVTYSVNEESPTLKWTAYKTTAKVGVGGEFKTITLTEVPMADKAEKALEGVKFSVPVSGIHTNNESRDTKIAKFFFGTMLNTELLSGKFTNLEGDNKAGQGIIKLKMNNVLCDLPFEYTFSGNKYDIKSELNIASWKAEASLDSLNNACYDLHKGADGISKTWPDVSITASVKVKEN